MAKTFQIEFHMLFVKITRDNDDGWVNNCVALGELPIIK